MYLPQENTICGIWVNIRMRIYPGDRAPAGMPARSALQEIRPEKTEKDSKAAGTAGIKRGGGNPMEYVLALSYGKDSLCCLGAIEMLGWPLDRIVHAEMWATRTIPADLPPMVEFKMKVNKIIKRRWGIEVEYIRHKMDYEQMFYRPVCKGKYQGAIKGWPLKTNARSWCKHLKLADKISGEGRIVYIGIAADEPERFHNLSGAKKSPLVEAGWTQAHCRKWCEDNGLLSPIYDTAARGGCWFCHNQGVGQLRLLRKKYPEYWALMLKWDKDSPVTFHPGRWEKKKDAESCENGIVMPRYIPGHTLHDFERRFAMEDEGLIFPDDKAFRWSMLDEELNYRWF